jgi:hypothetical protein
MAKDRWDKLVSEYARYDLKHPSLRLVTLAQWALESAFGQSGLAREHLNFSGLKYRKRMEGFATPVDYRAHDGEDVYCRFESLEAFIRGYWRFVESGPYEGWEDRSEDPLGYITLLRERGFAEDPDYVVKIAGIHQRLLAEQGGASDHDRPSRSMLDADEDVEIERLPGIDHLARGRYAAGLEGLIVHYDAFRIKPRFADADDSDWASRRTIEMGRDNRFRYLCISRTGRILAPGNWDWEHWGSHAGQSLCPATKRNWVSQYYAGIEMNNPGILYEAQEDGVFCPWYNSRRTDRGQVIRDHRGRCYRLNPDDEWYSAEQVRFAQGGNIAPGHYLPYTRAQYEALKALVRKVLRDYPTASLDRVYGHDEVSPGRKVDPGGALGHAGRIVTMEDFRQDLRNEMAVA